MNFIVFDEFVILLDLYIYESRENKKFLQIQILYRYAISFENKFVTRENFSYPASRKGTKRSQKSFHFKFPNSPFASYPDPVPLFSKKKKETKGKRFDKIFLPISSILGPCSSFHRGRNPLGISRYSSVGEKCGQKPVTKTRWPRKIWGTILLTKRARGNKNRPPPPLKPTRSVGFSTVVVKSE